jgi:hypothetical protein
MAHKHAFVSIQRTISQTLLIHDDMKCIPTPPDEAAIALAPTSAIQVHPARPSTPGANAMVPGTWKRVLETAIYTAADVRLQPRRFSRWFTRMDLREALPVDRRLQVD